MIIFVKCYLVDKLYYQYFCNYKYCISFSFLVVGLFLFNCDVFWYL